VEKKRLGPRKEGVFCSTCNAGKKAIEGISDSRRLMICWQGYDKGWRRKMMVSGGKNPPRARLKSCAKRSLQRPLHKKKIERSILYWERGEPQEMMEKIRCKSANYPW